MNQPKVKYQQYSFNITAIGQEVKIDVESDKLYARITGVNAILTDPRNKFSTLSLEINSKEILPLDFEVLRLLFREQVPFGYEYHSLEEKGGGSKIKGVYKDVNTGAAYPYTLTLSFKLEN